jgi:hypothetical protein
MGTGDDAGLIYLGQRLTCFLTETFRTAGIFGDALDLADLFQGLVTSRVAGDDL